MNKNEFIEELSSVLSGIPNIEKQKAIDYYSEILDDRIEDGLSEEAAVSDLDSIEIIREKILTEIPLPLILKEHASKPVNTLSVILIILGFPVWFPLIIAALAILFAFYITIGALLFSLFAVLLSFAVCGIAGTVAAVFWFPSNPAAAFFMLGSAFILGALSILLFYPSLFAARGLLSLTKTVIVKIKSLFVKRKVRD